MTAPDPCLVAEAFFAGPHACVPLGASPGFSGSAFARVEAANGVWCLRRWPAGFVPSTLRFIPTVLRHSRARGFSCVPRLAATATGETVVERDGALFDAQAWVDGAPLAEPVRDAAPVPNPVWPLPLARLAAVPRGASLAHREPIARGPEATGTRHVTFKNRALP